MERRSKGTFGRREQRQAPHGLVLCLRLGRVGTGTEGRPERALLPDVWRRRTKGEVDELAARFTPAPLTEHLKAKGYLKQ
jgi:hypothetical protein